MTKTSTLWMLAATALVVAAAPAAPVELGGVELGFDELYRPGHFTPVRAQITNNSGEPFHGELRITQSDDDGDRIVWRAQAVIAPRRTETRMVMFCPQRGTLEEGKVQLAVVDASGRAVASRSLNPRTVGSRAVDPPGSRVVGVIGPSHSPFDLLRRQAVVTSEPVAVVSIPMRNVPVLWQGLDLFEVIYWDNPDPHELSPEQQDALVHWTQRGGHLVLGLGSRARQLDSPGNRFFDARLLPVRVRQTAQRSRGFARAGAVLLGPGYENVELPPEVPVVVVTAQPGAVVLAYDSTVGGALLSRGAYGAGTVTVFASTLGESLLQQRDPARRYLPDVLLAKALASLLAMESSEPQTVWGASLTENLGAHLDSSTVGGVLVSLVVLMSLLYAALAGPGTWLYLRFIGRTHLSWWLFGAVVVAATLGGVLLTSVSVRGPAVSQVTVIDLQSGNRFGVVQGYVGLYEPVHRDVTLSLGRNPEQPGSDPHGTLMPMIDPHAGPATGYPDVRRYELNALDPSVVEDVPIRRTIKRFALNWHGDVGGAVHGTFRVDAQGRLRGSLHHDLPVPLQDARLFCAYERIEGDSWRTEYRVVDLGTLDPGRTRAVDSSDDKSQSRSLRDHHRSLEGQLGLASLPFGTHVGKRPFGPLVELLSTMQLYAQPAAQGSGTRPRAERAALGRLDRSAMLQPPRGGWTGQVMLIARAEGFLPARVRWDSHGRVNVDGPAVVRCLLEVRDANAP